ncbi:MAG: DNA repair protein RecN (Recombination protein N), partial [Candidatus Marinamargulisbacteria bacterium]
MFIFKKEDQLSILKNMLTSLRIENFAIIKSCELQFSQGFNVITGETGAGKSIIMDALSLLLGKSAQEGFIMEGQEASVIEGIFQLENLNIDPELATFLGDEKSLIIYRKITRKGGSTIRLN